MKTKIKNADKGKISPYMLKLEKTSYGVPTSLHDPMKRSIDPKVKWCFQLRIKVVMILRGSKTLSTKITVKNIREKLSHTKSFKKNSFL